MSSVKAGLCLLLPHCSPRGREWVQCLADDKGERKGTRKKEGLVREIRGESTHAIDIPKVLPPPSSLPGLTQRGLVAC